MVDMIVRMWEARAHPEAFTDLLAWVCDSVVPGLERSPGHVTTEVFTAPDDRIVVITRFRATPATIPPPPSHQVARDPHAWDFNPVDR